MNLSRSHRALIATVAVALLGAGCGSGNGDDNTAKAATTTSTSETGGASADGVTVTAVDYAYQGLPSSVAAGTKLSLKNSSTKELHELVAAALPAGEKRPVSELVKLSEAEFDALFTGPPAAVLIAAPGGGKQIEALGDGTLAKPGRYVVLCAIPTGADPAAYLDAVQKSQDGPPNVPGGPPHFTKGMFSEITVK